MSTSIRQVISVDKDKCVSCHRCIAVCPVKLCNDGSGSVVTINTELCIGCGHCISACPHDARIGIDDFDAFMEDIRQGKKIVAIIAPAVTVTFRRQALELNGWLKSIGVIANFDVSFGAELTTKSYVEHIKNEEPKLVIAQPCPALVTYCEIYKPSLLKYLAPADSPMAHTMKMIREFYPQYKDCKIAVISPCYAKRREFDEIGLGDYNVTMKSLSNYFKQHNINLGLYKKTPYDNPPAERAVLYSTPGGLMRTAERFVPGISENIRKIEGQPTMVEYFDELEKAMNAGQKPLHLVIDCLNCEHGCNGGAGTDTKGMSRDEMEGYVEARKNDRKKKWDTEKNKKSALKKLDKVIDSYWKPGLYTRTYEDHSDLYIRNFNRASDADIQEIFTAMGKTSKSDILDCGACGYKTCRQMAEAVFNGYNRFENCHHYLSHQFKIETKKKMEELRRDIERNNAVSEVGIALTKNVQKLNEISVANHQTIDGIKNLSNEVENIGNIVTLITDIADQAKIIAFNAELEASSAGESGKNFHIVATEVRRLTDGIIDSTKEIKERIAGVQKSTDTLIIAGESSTTKVDEGCETAKNLEVRFGIIKESAKHKEEQAKKIL